ncbi:MAG: FIST C-terminal domain-containing protein [Hyphomicrobiales bacterium]|nr:FIST C-terminal domain-containing protein [Hyphomicrobiales bacterium]
MAAFTVAHAGGTAWPDIADACAGGLGTGAGNLGFLYVTDHLSGDMADIVDRLRAATGVADWVGTAGLGICAADREYHDRPAAVAMVADLPTGSYRLVAGGTAADLDDWIAGGAPFGIVHGNPRDPKMPGALTALAERTGGFLVGGLTASRHGAPQVAGGPVQVPLSGVLFGPGVEVATGLSQGCAPIGDYHRITESAENVVMKLDDRPALDVFKQDAGDLIARDLGRAAGYIHAAFPVPGSDTGDYTVRNLMGIDPRQGWLAVGEAVTTGQRLRFVRRDPASARQDLAAMLANLRARLPGPPRGGLYVSCVARGPGMFGEEGAEVSILRDALGDIPLAGFYAGGEISNARLYGYTGVLTLFL